ncbi:hypothetical protein [Streptomyces sp. NPDC053367]|uniref:hypothetical protein n=1 Tax=Streptomyces sp. NPDC053367 TaxID=3365700 RepID=UPI0037D07ACA
MSEILSYLAAALPADVSAGARLLALQCALRMNAYLHVELRAGLLRSLRIDPAQACRELEQARWSSMVNGPGAARVAAELRDATLLARPAARGRLGVAHRVPCPDRWGRAAAATVGRLPRGAQRSVLRGRTE